jgi:hypothetical protein
MSIDYVNLEQIEIDSNNSYYNDGNGSNCIIKASDNSLIKGATWNVSSF